MFTVVLLRDRRGRLTLQDIFCASYPEDERTHALPIHVRRAACAILQCRTAALGGHVHACPDGHFMRIWYNSCRHRACPQCTYLQTERWVVLRQARLLACEHYHVLFTLPHALNSLWLAHVPVMSTLLLQAVRDPLGTLLADPKYLGAQPGIIAALHTWSQTLRLPPHVPCLVTGGGRTPAGQWVPVRNGFLLPVRVVRAVFRGKLRDARRPAVAQDALGLPEPRRPQQALNRLHRLGQAQKTPWNVHMRERYRPGAGVVTSLARYLRGGPLKKARLVAWDGDRVPFTYRASAEGALAGMAPRQHLTLSSGDFLPRWLRHVLGPHTRTVRSYGLSHPTHAETLARCRAQVGQPSVVVPVTLDWQTVCAPRGAAHPERCPACGQRLVCTGVIPRAGAPPPVRSGAHAA